MNRRATDNPSLCLSAQEVAELTDRERPTYQARVLRHMRVPFRRRPDGTLAVLRIHVESIEGAAYNDGKKKNEPELQI